MSIPAAALRVARPVVANPADVEAPGGDYVTVDRVRKVYNEGTRQEVEAVAPSSFAIKAGEFVALLGPSGCGKSTLLMMIAGLDAPSAGTIGVAGQALTAPRAETGIMFQDPTLLPGVRPARPMRRRAPAPPPCSTRSASAASIITSRASSPAACASGSRSAAPWSTSPTCC
jgi:hypothetical protein